MKGRRYFRALSSFGIEYGCHEPPLLRRGGVRVTALESADVGFPFSLSGQGGKPCHVPLPVEVVHRVHYHEEKVFTGIDLHREDTYLMLPFNDFPPDVSVGFGVLPDGFGVVGEG